MTTAPDRLATALADRYRIERELGQGGMATVYLAEDLKHKRRVALKVLKPELAAVLGAERFVQEITTTASLQHPHILPLFDSGTADGFLFYVMPFIEGETLRGKLDRETQLGVDEAVRITSDVASALHYAHTHGVIHRDIKPENILLHDGRPMVADFGIALAVSAAAGGRMTETGLSLGTPHYMSPEQATAEKEITGRSDVYSLGSVLYEMLTGDPPHTGSSAQQIIMKIITEPADPVTRVRKSVPPNVAAAVGKALEKLPADRFESAKAFAEALANPAFTAMTRAGAGGAGATGARGALAGRRALVAVGSIALLALAAAAWGWLRPAPTQPTLVADLALGPAELAPGSDIAISPDGSMLAYAGRSQGGQLGIWLRRLDGAPEFRLLAGTENGGSPDFSPDGRSIVFRRQTDGLLVRVSSDGGGATTIVGASSGLWPHWGADGLIAYWAGIGNFVVPVSGGEPRLLRGLAGRRNFLLPDGSGVLGVTDEGAAVYDLRTDSVTLLVRGGMNPVYAASGHLLYAAQDRGLFAVPFDLKSHRVTGRPVRILDRVTFSLNSRGYALSRNGTLVQYDGTGEAAAYTQLVIHSFDGGADTLPLAPARRREPRFSPTGRYIAYSREAPSGNRTDLFTYDRQTRTETPITFNEDINFPIWSPDGRHLLFVADPGDLVTELRVKPADNSGEARVLIRARARFVPSGWPRDDLILFSRFDLSGENELFSMEPVAGATPRPYLDTSAPGRFLTLSKDGRFAAYEAREGNRYDVWLRDFPTPKGKWQVSRGGGALPRWSPDGRYIYFWNTGPVRDTLMRAQVDRLPSVVVRAPERVATFDVGRLIGNWDLHPDGKRYIIVQASEAPAAAGAPAPRARHLLHLNFFTTLKAAVSLGVRE
ncbi:MAG: serine/threonine-protein kinase [Gemmatimonadetes bacterium]|nr:serine/threonine-protein kinase [Gemmatimonadota bacterium]